MVKRRKLVSSQDAPGPQGWGSTSSVESDLVTGRLAGGAASSSGRTGWIQCTQQSRLWVGACRGGSTWKFFNDCFNFLGEIGNNLLFFTR